MDPRSGKGRRFAAAAAFVAAALAFVPLGIALRYLTISEAPSAHDAGIAAAAAAVAALHAALVYGPVYGAIGVRLPTGFGAPVAAFVGAILPTAARLAFLPRPGGAPAALVGAHAFLVELALGLALALLSLGAGARTAVAGCALLWGARFLLHEIFYGGVVPVLELFSAIAAAVAVALVLKSALAPYRDALLEVP